nr:unnamed protein product [Callosobruchus chinensis]
MMYNSTPHSTTGKTPSELFFGRNSRDKILHFVSTQNWTDEGDIRDKDKTQKERGRKYGDKKRKAVTSDLTEGDKVYVKTTERTNKLSSNYNPTPHTVEARRDGDVNLRNDETGQICRRNVTHLK